MLVGTDGLTFTVRGTDGFIRRWDYTGKFLPFKFPGQMFFSNSSCNVGNPNGSEWVFDSDLPAPNFVYQHPATSASIQYLVAFGAAKTMPSGSSAQSSWSPSLGCTVCGSPGCDLSGLTMFEMGPAGANAYGISFPLSIQ